MSATVSSKIPSISSTTSTGKNVRVESSYCFSKVLIYLLFLPDQRNLGMSMKVERSSVDQVKKRFEALKKKKEEKTKEYDLSERIQELKEEVTKQFLSGKMSGKVLLQIIAHLLGRETERIPERKEKR